MTVIMAFQDSNNNISTWNEQEDEGIWCRLISEYHKADFYVSDKEELLRAVQKNNPNIVFIDVNLFEKIDGIETSKIIRNHFNTQVMYLR